MVAAIDPQIDPSPTYPSAVQPAEPESLFNRPPRILRALPREEVVIPAPPRPVGPSMNIQLATVVLPVLTAVMYLIVMAARGGQQANVWLSLPMVGVSFASAGLGIHNYFRQRRLREQKLREQAQSYDDALRSLRERLSELHQQQRAIREANDPELATLARIAEGELDTAGNRQPAQRLWERRPTDDDFLAVRIGRGNVPTSITIKPPQSNLLEYTADLRRAIELANEFAVVADVPLTATLRTWGSLGVAGPSGKALEFTRALLWQLAVHHSPKEVRIAAFWDSRFDTSWEWLRWLPHTRSLDGSEDYRLLARLDSQPEALQEVLGALSREFQQRAEQPAAVATRAHLVLVVGDYQHYGRTIQPFVQVLQQGARLGSTAICLVDAVRQVPGECGAYVDLSQTPTLAVAGPSGGMYPFTPGSADRPSSNRLARALAPVTQIEADGRRELPRSVRLLPLLGIHDAKAYDPQQLWHKLPQNSWHPIPCGLRDATEALEINLNEGFDGVHGMIAGTTGSGKSEFLLTFLLALAIKHGPDRVNFMLIDFKGGATFQGIEALPHTAGVVTDLKGNMAERALIAINSELDRRKQRLAQASQVTPKVDVPNIREYRRHGFEQQPHFGPMPNLLIAIDEFDEMVRDYPDFVTELVRVAKQGRSLGVHLLFATQQPSLIKEGLTRNLTYWIALRVTGTDDSKTMVTIPDAAYLTTETPGRGFFRVGKRVVQFQSARITVPYQPPTHGSDLGYVDVTGRWQPISKQDRRVAKLRDALGTLLGAAQQPQPATLQQLTTTFLQTYQNFDHTGMQRRKPYPGSESQLQQRISELFNSYLVGAEQPEGEGARRDIDGLVEQLLTLMHADITHEHELALITQAMMNDPSTGVGYAAARYPIWTEPLNAEIVLADLLGYPSATRWLQAPIGLLDLPATAQQQPFVLDLANRDGNILILGSASSGKTTLVRTLMLALAATHSPADLWIYAIDPTSSGCGLMPLNSKTEEVSASSCRLPHIADSFTAAHTSKVERLLIELQDHIRQRLSLLQQHGVDTLAQLYERRSTLDTLPPGILVVIDNIAELTAAQPEVVDTFKALIRDARKCGINFVVTGYTWRDVAPIQSSFETRIALRLNDAADSEAVINKAYAARISPEQPGRAFLRTSERPIELQIALPVLRHLDGTATADPATSMAYSDTGPTIQAAINLVVERCAAVVAGRPQPLRSLSTRVELSELLVQSRPAAVELGTPIGIDSISLQPVQLDFATKTPHLLIAGGPRSGKSELLRTIITGLATRYEPGELQLVLVDYRRRVLQRFAHLEHVRATALTLPAAGGAAAEQRAVKVITNEQEVRALVTDLAGEMTRRVGSGILGPRIVLVISNWDLLQDTYSLWKPLGTFVMQGRDLGLHLVVTGAEYGGFTSTDMLKMARLERCAIYLGQPSESSTVASTLGIKLPRQAAQLEMPPGRGYLTLQGQVQLVQFALTTSEVHVAGA